MNALDIPPIQTTYKPVPAPLHAEIVGTDTVSVAGITVRAYAPVLEACRRLIELGHDPMTPLQAYRGNTLCVVVRSIGAAADLEISHGSDGFRRRRGADTASPVAPSNLAATFTWPTRPTSARASVRPDHPQSSQFEILAAGGKFAGHPGAEA